MATAATYTKAGAKATSAAKLDKGVFEVAPKNHDLLKQAYNTYLANGRGNFAVTKTRGLVSGGGKKPWKQKGTGRARFGSSRNPIWRGGGIAFGPTGEENYTKLMNVKAKRLAVRQALSVSAAANKVVVVEDVKATKTADLAKLFEKVGATRRTLLVVENKSIELDRASRNIQGLTVVHSPYLNVFDILNADTVVFTSDSLKAATERLNKETK